MDLEEVSRIREEELYPALFGPVRRGIFPLTHDLFTGRFRQEEVDPRWLSMGVFGFAPTPRRPSWLYVTSGYSNPWGQDAAHYRADGESGKGAEFTFSVTEQGDWAIAVLQSMLAYDLLCGEGRLNNERLGLHARIPLGSPINGDPSCAIRSLLLVEREDGPKEFSLPSGIVILVGFTGVSDAELAFARANGAPALLARLRAVGFHPTTDPHRQSIL